MGKYVVRKCRSAGDIMRINQTYGGAPRTRGLVRSGRLSLEPTDKIAGDLSIAGKYYVLAATAIDTLVGYAIGRRVRRSTARICSGLEFIRLQRCRVVANRKVPFSKPPDVVAIRGIQCLYRVAPSWKGWIQSH